MALWKTSKLRPLFSSTYPESPSFFEIRGKVIEPISPGPKQGCATPGTFGARASFCARLISAILCFHTHLESILHSWVYRTAFPPPHAGRPLLTHQGYQKGKMGCQVKAYWREGRFPTGRKKFYNSAQNRRFGGKPGRKASPRGRQYARHGAPVARTRY